MSDGETQHSNVHGARVFHFASFHSTVVSVCEKHEIYINATKGAIFYWRKTERELRKYENFFGSFGGVG